jgi:hypothetical protein
MEEARKVVMMFTKALSTLFPKKKGDPPVNVGDINTYQADDCNEPLFIFLILILSIILTNLIRSRSKRKQMQTTPGDETQIQTLITKTVSLNLNIFKKLEI